MKIFEIPFKFLGKWLDKLIKLLKTDRNTFFTYILTLLTVYILVDRFSELLLMCFTGISVSYWGPIKYTFALACPVFAFLFSGQSAFASSHLIKLTFVYVYVIALYTIGISMAVQWINFIGWLLLLSVPNYVGLVTEFSYLIKPAFQALALYLPLVTFYPVFKFFFAGVNDSKPLRDSINDYQGIDLSNKKAGTGKYYCENIIGTDDKDGKNALIPERRRFEAMAVIGASGSGKTSLIFEPMIARDLEKKLFFFEISKEMGFAALKSGIANLNKPYDNKYLNENFSLNMINANSGKEKLYNAYMDKMIYGKSDDGKFIYRNIGITFMAPDFETISHMLDVAKNLNLKVNLIDPLKKDSIGLNPFVHDDPVDTAVAISTVLYGMYVSKKADVDIAFREHAASQAVENLAILLKTMYPRLHDGLLPTLEDLLNMLNNFDLAQEMCEQLEENTELASKHSVLISYFKKNFYAGGIGREDTEKFVYTAATQLDTLLRIEGVRNILCNRSNNVNFANALENGEITYICTRRGDLGATIHTAFGLFAMLIMQHAVLKRPGYENTRIPHFLYIDEFSDFVGASTEPLFTLYRKYRVGTIISVQNLDQLGVKSTSKYRQTILANSATKVTFGNNSPEDNEWWVKELLFKREWAFTYAYNTDKVEYDPKFGNATWKWKPNFEPGKLEGLAFKRCAYKTKDLRGKNKVGIAHLNFLSEKYKSPKKLKSYNFSKFTNGITEDTETSSKKIIPRKTKFDYQHVTFDVSDNGDVDPIKYNSSSFFNNSDALTFNFNKKKED